MVRRRQHDGVVRRTNTTVIAPRSHNRRNPPSWQTQNVDRRDQNRSVCVGEDSDGQVESAGLHQGLVAHVVQTQTPHTRVGHQGPDVYENGENDPVPSSSLVNIYVANDPIASMEPAQHGQPGGFSTE